MLLELNEYTQLVWNLFVRKPRFLAQDMLRKQNYSAYSEPSSVQPSAESKDR